MTKRSRPLTRLFTHWGHLGYLDRVVETCIRADEFSMNQPSGWDNRKLKIGIRHKPRGKAYKRMVQHENNKSFREMEEHLEWLNNLLAKPAKIK